jgi:hypothetical protein
MPELHGDLRGVVKEIRPDFDLAAPGLREAWERGDRDQFLVDTLEEPIRYTEGKSIGINANPWGRGARPPLGFSTI